MSTRRRLKQFVYLGAFIAIVVVIILLISAAAIIPKPGSAPTTTPIAYSPIVLEKATAIPHILPSGATRVDIVVQLRNPNARAGVGSYPVSVTLIDPSGQEISTRQEETFLLPGALQYLILTDVSVPRQSSVSQVVVDTPDAPEFIEVPPSVPIPQFQTFLRGRTEKRVGAEVIETQTGLVTNDSTFAWNEVQVSVVALNSDREIIATGKTFLGTLTAGEQREFIVQWPKSSQPIQQVIAVPSTNMFSEENIVEILGNPESLR